jgi:adenylate cyclase
MPGILKQKTKRKSLLLAAVSGGMLVSALGVGLVLFPALSGALSRLSYDLPFVFRPQHQVPTELVIVYFDTNVKALLGAPQDQPLPRRYYTRLLKKVKEEGARIVLFDILMDEPGKDPEVDREFANQIQSSGPVVIVADYVQGMQGNAATAAIIPPVEALRINAACGLARISTDTGDGGIRRLDTGVEEFPSASWAAASILIGDSRKDESKRLKERWLNYYGPPGSFLSVNLDTALDPNGVSTNLFRNRIVLVGSRPSTGVTGTQQDEFVTPYSRFGYPLASGAEIHAISLINLLRGDWLERLSSAGQVAIVVVWGIVSGMGLMWVRPGRAAWVSVASVLLIGAVSIYCQLQRHLWWTWMVPAAAQTPAAFLWSVGWQYSIERRQRKKLRNAFAGYLSPHLADRIAAEEFDLSLGGKTVEATVLFSDLDGFTSASETLDPEKVSILLTTYFNRTTRGILKEEGTIIKYMGDSVMAVWGAPLPDAKQAERAVIAAWEMIKNSRDEISGRTLRTRIGINSGPALAGNLGSDFRFDYSVIGDTTNTASRLENLNKQLGTEILISESTRRQLTNCVSTRSLGRFLLSGKSQPVAVHEVLGVDARITQQFPWVALFEAALQHFVNGEFDLAESSFRKVSEMRGGDDGPSKFYLAQIAAVRNTSLPDAWQGVVRISSK